MILFSRKDMYINFDSDSNIIIVTGISGSGKSTIAKELKEKYGYEIISFDILFNYEYERGSNPLEDEIIKAFIKKYPKYKDFSKNETGKEICEDFYLFVEEYVNKHNLKIILDGAYFVDKVDYNLYKHNRIVFKRSSILRCMINRHKRTRKIIKNKNYGFIRNLKEYYWTNKHSIKKIPKWIKTNRNYIKTITDGNMNEISNEEMKEIELELLKYLKKICNENNIKYYISSGTLLGAIKYKGFIPWDDDIDVCLVRDEYNKLIKCVEEDHDSRYKLLTYKNTKDYYYPFGKLVDTRTKLIDNAKEIKELGVFIDVFPLDYYNDDYDKIYRNSRFARNLCSLRMRIKNNISKSVNKENNEKREKSSKIKGFIYGFVDIISLPLGYNYWCKVLDKRIIKHKDGKYIGRFYHRSEEFFSSTIIDEVKEYIFEGEKFTSIKDYDTYLTVRYGDYKKDLPKELQISHHQIKAYYRKD